MVGNRISIPYGAIKSGKQHRRQHSGMEISIPYGAIKRNCPNISIAPFVISIPYGAIKRRMPELLMSAYNMISIPYGAIKRYKANVACTGVTYFNSLWCD